MKAKRLKTLIIEKEDFFKIFPQKKTTNNYF